MNPPVKGVEGFNQVYEFIPMGQTFFSACRRYSMLQGAISASYGDQRAVNIYRECLSQLVSNLTKDYRQFLVNIQGCPNFMLIEYTDLPIVASERKAMGDAVLCAGIALYRMVSDVLDMEGLYPTLVSCSTTFIMLRWVRYTEPQVIQGPSEVPFIFPFVSPNI